MIFFTTALESSTNLFSEQTIFKIQFSAAIFAGIDFHIFHVYRHSRSGPYQGLYGYQFLLLLSGISIPGPFFFSLHNDMSKFGTFLFYGRQQSPLKAIG